MEQDAKPILAQDNCETGTSEVRTGRACGDQDANGAHRTRGLGRFRGTGGKTSKIKGVDLGKKEVQVLGSR